MIWTHVMLPVLLHATAGVVFVPGDEPGLAGREIAYYGVSILAVPGIAESSAGPAAPPAAGVERRQPSTPDRLLSVGDLRRVMRRNRALVDLCLRRADRTCVGRCPAQVRITLAPGGVVQAVAVDAEDPRLRACVGRAVRHWRFPDDAAGQQLHLELGH